MDDRTVAWDVMGTLFDVSPISERYGEATMPRLLHAALALQATGRFVPFPALVESLLGKDALEAFAQLDPYEDAEPALQTLQDAGARIATLTNGSPDTTEKLLERANLRHFFDELLTVERAQVYKPAPEPYRLLERGSSVLVAAHDWDCAGAANAGVRTIYVDRKGEGWKLPAAEPERVQNLVAAAEAAVS